MPSSPFLQGFIPPTYLTPLSPDEGRGLVARGGFASSVVVLALVRWERLVAVRNATPGDPVAARRADRAIVLAAGLFGVALANHGLAATGPDLLEAYNRAEIVEDSAQAYLHCRLLGREPNLDF